MPVCRVCERPTRPEDHWVDHLWRCRGCSHTFADPAAYPQGPEVFQENYFGGDDYYSYAADGETHRKNFNRYARIVERFIPTGCLFEIGCAYGFFLEVAEAKWHVSGIDVSRPGTEFARRKLGVEAFTGDFLEHRLPEGRLDGLCMWDMIQTLRRPDLYIEKAAHSLRKGGHIFVSTGNMASLNARARGKDWRLVHPPQHMQYFSRQSLMHLLQRKGLEPVHYRRFGFYRSLATMFHQVGREFGEGAVRRFFMTLRNSPLGKLKIYLDLFDFCLVVARKS